MLQGKAVTWKPHQNDTSQSQNHPFTCATSQSTMSPATIVESVQHTLRTNIPLNCMVDNDLVLSILSLLALAPLWLHPCLTRIRSPRCHRTHHITAGTPADRTGHRQVTTSDPCTVIRQSANCVQNSPAVRPGRGSRL